MIGVCFLIFCIISICYYLYILYLTYRLERYIEDDIFRFLHVDRKKISRTWKFKI